MKHIYAAAFQTFILLASVQVANAQAPVITAATPVSNTVEQWGKFEIKLDITANWTNPYDYDEIRVDCIFTDPDGVTRAVDGFFMQDYQLNTQTSALTPLGSRLGTE